MDRTSCDLGTLRRQLGMVRERLHEALDAAGGNLNDERVQQAAMEFDDVLVAYMAARAVGQDKEKALRNVGSGRGL